MSAQDGFSLSWLLGEDGRHAGLQYARLFRRDLRQRVTQEELVIEVNRRNHR
jgi:hypothetical protein